MEAMIFSGFGVEIFRRDEKFYVRPDAGDKIAKLPGEEISAAEAARAQNSASDAVEVLLACERRRRQLETAMMAYHIRTVSKISPRTAGLPYPEWMYKTLLLIQWGSKKVVIR